jgi:hypothetical protein
VKPKPVDQPTSLIERARDLAADAMELHILSFRMGNGTCKDEDFRACQRIIAEADGLARDIAAMVKA